MLEEIKKIIAANVGIDVADITETSSFDEDLNIDSLDLFEVVMALEERFDIEIPSEDLENMKNAGDVVKYIQSHKE